MLDFGVKNGSLDVVDIVATSGIFLGITKKSLNLGSAQILSFWTISQFDASTIILSGDFFNEVDADALVVAGVTTPKEKPSDNGDDEGERGGPWGNIF